MPHPCPHHCPKSGGGGLAAVLAVVAVVIVAAAARPAVHAAEDVLEVVIVAVASVAGLAVVGAAVIAAVRVHRWHARNRLDVARHAPIAQRGSQALSAPRASALEAPRHVIQLHPITEKEKQS